MSAMERYIDYKLEDFLLDDSFRKWVYSGAVLSGTSWENLLWQYPHKRETFEKAIVVVREWKNPPSSLTDEQMYRDIDTILSDIDKKEKVSPSLGYRWIGYAAMVLLTLGIVGYFVYVRQSAPSDQVAGMPKADFVEVFNSDKVDKIITLPDGSLVKLSPGSQVSYGAGFADAVMRNVNLIGEAFFDVKRDVKRPFSVYSGGITTRVLGTSFTVRSGARDVSVTVNTGRVSVSRSGKESDPMVLTPNQKAVYLTSEQTLTRTLAEVPVMVHQEELKGRFAFDGEPAGNIFQALEKAYGIPIKYNGDVLKDCFVTLPFREEPFYQKLDILCRTIKATYKVADDGVTIESEGCE